MKKKVFIQFLAVALIAVVFTVLVKTVDLGFVSNTDSAIGFASINLSFNSKFGFNPLLYNVSEYLGYSVFAIVAFFALLGIRDLVKNKSLLKVDSDLYALAITYIFTLVVYFVFDKLLVINLRPLIMSGEMVAEPSFPSSHTLLAVVVCGTAIAECGKVKKSGLRIILTLILSLLMAATVLTRLFSGVHWVTDIVGGVLWGEALMMVFQLISTLLRKEK